MSKINDEWDKFFGRCLDKKSDDLTEVQNTEAVKAAKRLFMTGAVCAMKLIDEDADEARTGILMEMLDMIMSDEKSGSKDSPVVSLKA